MLPSTVMKTSHSCWMITVFKRRLFRSIPAEACPPLALVSMKIEHPFVPLTQPLWNPMVMPMKSTVPHASSSSAQSPNWLNCLMDALVTAVRANLPVLLPNMVVAVMFPSIKICVYIRASPATILPLLKSIPAVPAWNDPFVLWKTLWGSPTEKLPMSLHPKLTSSSLASSNSSVSCWLINSTTQNLLVAPEGLLPDFGGS